jgi:alanyl aminopeptidase
MMKTRALSVACVALLMSACGQQKDTASHRKAPPHAVAAADAVPQGQLSRVVLPTHYQVRLTIDPTRARFSGHTEIAVQVTRNLDSLYLHGLELHVTRTSARLANGKSIAVSYKQVSEFGVARLAFASTLPRGEATLVFDYDAPYNTSLAGLYKVVDRGDSYAFTQFENTDARRAFPSFDEPGFKAPFDIQVIAPSADKVVTNTPILTASPAGKGMTATTFLQTKPLPTYLVALAIGPLDIVDGGVVPPNKFRKLPIVVRGVTARGNGLRLKYALSLTPSIITALENYYGIAYPFQKLDVLAVPDFAAGAMENAGAITYRERLLLDADQSLETRRASLLVQAHELAHQWFGDLVTPAWWDDIWLNESFANWMESKASAVVRPNEEYGREVLHSNLNVMALDEAASARRIHQPVHNMDDIDNAFDSITYDKGAAVLGMFESYVGEEGWRAGIHAYLTKFAFRNATAQDFIGTIAAVTKHPEIVAAFNSYIDQAGIPQETLNYACENSEKLVAVKQSLFTQLGRASEPRKWGVPMCFADMAGHKTCSLAGNDLTEINLKTTCTTTLMPNAGGRGYYRFLVDDAGWMELLKTAPKLGAADQLTLFANIDAAFRSGHASAPTYFEAVRILAPVAKWDLLKSMQESLHRFRTSLLEETDLADYRSLMTRLFVPRLNALGLSVKPGETPDNTLAREFLANLVVEEARDPATLAALTAGAQPYVASKGQNNGPLAPDILPAAMRAGVILEGKTFADTLTGSMKASNGENFRRSGFYAVAGAQNTDALQSVFAWTGTMRVGEIRYLYQYMKDEPIARDALWSFMKTNFALLEKRVSSQAFGRAPSLLDTACSDAARNDLQGFFGPRTKELEGTARPLAQTDEKIGYCVALKSARATDFQAALHAAAVEPL